MPVIINDFEIVVEPPTTADPAKVNDISPKADMTQAAQTRPEDVEQIMRRLMQRRARLLAD